MRALPVTVAIATANAHRQCVTKSVVEAIVYYVPTGQSERQPLSYSWL